MLQNYLTFRDSRGLMRPVCGCTHSIDSTTKARSWILRETDTGGAGRFPVQACLSSLPVTRGHTACSFSQPWNCSMYVWCYHPRKSTTDSWDQGIYCVGLVTQATAVQSLSRIRLFVTPQTAAHQASLSITDSWSLLKLMSIESVMPFNHRNLSRPLLLMPSIFSSSRVFYSKSVLRIRWPKYWRSSISLSNEYSGLIFFRNDWLDFLAIQGTLKSLLQHPSSKALILRHSGCFMVQLSHPYVTTGITITLIKWTFVGKVMSLVFNMLFSLVITFLPRSKRF